MTTINILKESEKKAFNNIGDFSDEERKELFKVYYLDEETYFRKDHTKLFFTLLRGYFLAHGKFFQPHQFRQIDIDYLCKEFELSPDSIHIKNYKESTFRSHQKTILKHCNFIPFTEFAEKFQEESDALVRTSLKPNQIFYALLRILRERKIEIPSYTVFAEAITNSLNKFENFLTDKINELLPDYKKEILNDLIKLPADLEEEVSSKNPYLLTKLKKPIQSTTTKRIKESLDDFAIIEQLHTDFAPIVENLDLSDDLLNYYAVWLIKLQHIRFEEISTESKKHLFLLAFIVYQYRIRQDLFVDSFLQSIQKYQSDTEKSISMDFLSQRPTQLANVQKVKKLIYTSKEQLDKVKEILNTYHINDSEKVRRMHEVLIETDGKPFHDQIIEALNQIETSVASLKDQMYYQQLISGHKKLTKKVGGILQILNFNTLTSDKKMMEAIEFYQKRKGKINEKSPTAFIKKNELKWVLSEDNGFDYAAYKVILFREVANNIKSGSLNLSFSDRYRSVEEYMISAPRWTEEKDFLLKRANLESLVNGNKFIDERKHEMHEQYQKTNTNALDNKYLKFTTEGKPIASTPKIEKNEIDSLIELLSDGNFLPLTKILSDVKFSSDYLSSFIHFSRKGSKGSAPEEIFYAAIIALGCNIGIRKMGKISKGVGPERLEYAVKWFFTKENLDEANALIISKTNELVLPEIYKKRDGTLHTSSDGQKFDVIVPSLHASHSFKYFGSGKGVTAYSFIDEYNRMFYNTVLSASEREAAYVIDGLMHNEEIESSIHSTDTHGFSEIVFAVSNCLGIFFSPRIKNYKDQIIYTFKENPRKNYESESYQILPSPSQYIDINLLSEQWDNILRLLVSIKLRETTASKLFARLSSYSKMHPLYRALKELGRVYKTIFVLRYLDELPLRQNTEKMLNRIEQSHQFAKAVFFGNSQEFKQDTKEEQEIAVGARHLIQNSIVLWNYLKISQVLANTEDEETFKSILESVKNSSVMTWQHINMHGEYDFEQVQKEGSFFDMTKIDSLQL